MPLRIVLQGFGPFGGHTENPSSMLVESLAADPPDGVEIVPLILEVSRARVRDEIPRVIDQERPDAWVGVGLAAGRTSVAVEQVAVNLADYEIEDVDGARATGEPVDADGPAAYLTGLPARGIVSKWRQAAIPGYLSYSAGAYLCNESFYRASAAADRLGLPTRVGFIHVPLLPRQVHEPKTQPSMTLDLQRQAIAVALSCLAADADPARSETLSPRP